MIQLERSPTIVEQPLIHFGREVCGDLAAGLRREWLISNGLGGYAAGTLAGINTRRYHGMLVAALTPPVERTVLVGGLIEWAVYDERCYALSTHEYSAGVVDQHGYRNLQAKTPPTSPIGCCAARARLIWRSRRSSPTVTSTTSNLVW